MGEPATPYVVPLTRGLWVVRVSPDIHGRPPCGDAAENKGGIHMTIVRRVVLAIGSIAALALAGGAHFRAG